MGGYLCPECQKSMIWQSDWDVDELEAEGIESMFCCDSCNIDLIKYYSLV